MMADADPRAPASDDKVHAHLAAIVDVEVARAAGRVGDALATLKAQIDGSELYIAHVALMDAYSANGDAAAALAEARWLATHRGRAYAEYGAHQTLTVFNVAQSDLALLRAAELSLALGRREEARKNFDEFRRAWPLAGLPATLVARAKAVAAALP
jgi:hypothetical protein